MPQISVNLGSFYGNPQFGQTAYGTTQYFNIPDNNGITGCSVTFSVVSAGGFTQSRNIALNGSSAHSGWASSGMTLDHTLLSAGQNSMRPSVKAQANSSCSWEITNITLYITYTAPIGGGGGGGGDTTDAVVNTVHLNGGANGANAYAGAGAAATLSWTATDGVGNPIPDYTILRSVNGGTFVIIDYFIEATSYTVYAPTTPGHFHQYKVVARAPYGDVNRNSGRLYARSAVSAPTWCSVSPSTRYPGESVTLTWGGALGGAGTSVYAYAIWRSGVYVTQVSETSYTFSAPAPGSYAYQVYALSNISGYNSGPSPAAGLTVIRSAVSAPTSVTASASNVFTGYNITISWSGDSAGHGVAISKYELYCNNVYVAETTARSITVAAPSTAGSAVYKVKTIGSVSGYDSELSTASATVTVQHPRSTGALTYSTVPMNGTSTNTLTVQPSSTAFNHKVIWYTTAARKATDKVEQSLAVGVTTAVLNPVPKSWCNAYTGRPPYTANCTLETYNGETKIGELNYTFSVTVPADVQPTVSLDVAPVNGLGGLYVRTKSQAQLTATASGAYGSTIESYSMSGNGKSGTTNPWTTPDVYSAAGTHDVSVTVTDTRGRTASKIVTITVTDYNTPVINPATAERCTSDGTVYNDGTYIRVIATMSASSVGGNNTLVTEKVQYRDAGGTTWTDGDTAFDGDAVIGTGNFAITNAYEILITVIDTVGMTSTHRLTVLASDRLFDFRTDRASIGRVAGTTANKFILPDNWTTNINADQLDGNHASAFAEASHPHVKSDITDFAHSHGNITNDGKVGTTADLTLITGAGGLVVAGCPYAIGDILQTLNTTSPATRWAGTTWSAIGAQFLLGADGTYTAGETGGAAVHKHGLSTAYVKIRITQYNVFGSDTDHIACTTYNGYYSNGGMTSGAASVGTKVHGLTDDGSSMPPYLAVYMWKRTA